MIVIPRLNVIPNRYRNTSQYVELNPAKSFNSIHLYLIVLKMIYIYVNLVSELSQNESNFTCNAGYLIDNITVINNIVLNYDCRLIQGFQRSIEQH